MLDQAGVKPQAREFVFFGADHGEEDVEFRGTISKVDQQFGRSLSREKAMSPEPFLAYALNGEPLTRHQGSPLRLLVPGWYGVANVKWLSQIHVQEEQYLGKFQARWYRTLKGEMIDGEMKWNETAVTHMQLKSFIARVTRDGSRPQGARRRAERRHADQVGRSPRGRWPVAAGDDGSGHERQVFLEAVHLHLERRHAGRAHARLARDRRHRKSAADRRGAGQQEDVPRRQLAASAQTDDILNRGSTRSGARPGDPRASRAGQGWRRRSMPQSAGPRRRRRTSADRGKLLRKAGWRARG